MRFSGLNLETFLGIWDCLWRGNLILIYDCLWEKVAKLVSLFGTQAQVDWFLNCFFPVLSMKACQTLSWKQCDNEDIIASGTVFTRILPNGEFVKEKKNVKKATGVVCKFVPF